MPPSMIIWTIYFTMICYSPKTVWEDKDSFSSQDAADFARKYIYNDTWFFKEKLGNKINQKCIFHTTKVLKEVK